MLFTVLFLCWFATVQYAVENLWYISNLYVCIEVKNIQDVQIVQVDVLATHGSFW